MRRLIEKRLLKHFGVAEQGLFWSPTMQNFKEDLIFSIEKNQMLIVAGEIGSGKSMLFQAAAAELENTTFVFVQNYFKENIKIGSIINALIYDLSDESPRRDMEARSRQVIRIIGNKHVAEKRNICLVIEDAHELHPNTLRALKALRESSFNGINPLFSTILIGHPLLVIKLQSRKEAYWRSHTMELNEDGGWMQFAERVNYIKVVFGKAIEPDARKRVATIAKTPLEMDFYIENKMREARKAGKKIIDSEVVRPRALEFYEASQISLKEIADETGLGKTTVHDILHSKSHPKENEVTRAIQKIRDRKENMAKAS